MAWLGRRTRVEREIARVERLELLGLELAPSSQSCAL